VAIITCSSDQDSVFQGYTQSSLEDILDMTEGRLAVLLCGVSAKLMT
jgi:hypothetical protein